MPTEPSSYEQGFRDALLSVRFAFESADTKHRTPSPYVFEEPAIFILEDLVAYLDQLLDQKNHDLWDLLALAQASVPPEAQALRDHLRAPSGVLIDTAGRMLFLRLNGTEYDTGVLGLLSENAELKQRVDLVESGLPDDAGRIIRIVVNEVKISVYRHIPVTFEILLKLSKRPDAQAFAWRDPGTQYTGFQGPCGVLLPGQSILPTEGMVFYVA